LGYVLEFGGWTIYHSGDTVRYEGMTEKLRSFRTDVALLPINDGYQNGAFRAIYSDAKRPSWQKTWTRNWLYRAISESSNSIALHRTNSSTNAASWVSPSRCCVAAKNGAASLKRKPGVPADAAS
jgi:hypothetical protein